MKHPASPDLAREIVQDPETGLRWAMRDYAALVRGVLRRILPGHERDVEECMADVFVALWRHAQDLCEREIPVRAWLIVTARNTGINRYRALRRRKRRSADVFLLVFGIFRFIDAFAGGFCAAAPFPACHGRSRAGVYLHHAAAGSGMRRHSRQ